MTSSNSREVISVANLIEAMHNYHNHLALSNSPLAGLASVQARLAEPAGKKPTSASPLGAALAAELKGLIASLEPQDARLPQTHPRRLAYEVLHQTVVLGRSATDTAARLYISRSQLYRIREKAINDLAQFWQERELREFGETKAGSEESQSVPPTPVEAEGASASLIATPPLPASATASTALAEPVVPAATPGAEEDLALVNNGFRIVNVVVANLSGFNRITATLDLETAHGLLSQIMSRMSQVLNEADGYINQWYERGFSAFFGAPTSHEDDPLRAVRVALKLLAALAELKESMPGLSPQVRKIWPSLRIGIGRGRVFAGTSQAGAASTRYTVTGRALEVAATLADTALAGWILIDHQTYRQVRGLFEIEALATPPNNAAQPDEDDEASEITGPIYRVFKERPQGFLIEARDLQGLEINMVGRELEWNMLLGLYEEARTNQTVRQLTVVGLPGNGKSRLEYEFRKYLELQPHLTRYWRGQSAQEGRLPYQPFAEMLRDKAGIMASDDGDQARTRLLELCRSHFGNEALTLNNPAALAQGLTRSDEVAHLLSVMLDLGWPESPFLEALTNNSPQLAQAQTFRAFADLCERVTRSGEPLVLVLEDLHWAQETSLALWNYLSTDLAEAPILLLGLTRPELYERKTDWGLGLDRHIRLDLKPLSPARTRELIRHILRKVSDQTARQEIEESIVQVADGNPFYVEEIIKMLLDNNVLVVDEATDTWLVNRQESQAPKENGLTQVWLPSTVEGLIQARLDRLPTFDRQLVGLAAVAGRVFSEEALQYLLVEVSRKGENLELQAGLRRLQQRELITRKVDRIAPGATQDYIFRHSLLREVIYNNLPQKVRGTLHRSLGDWLAANRDRTERRAEQGTAVAIAEHYERAGLARQAARFYEEAGDEARAAYAINEAVNSYRKALAMLQTVVEATSPGPGDGVSLKELLDAEQADNPLVMRLRLLEKKGLAETALGLYPTALADFEEAMALLPPNASEKRTQLLLEHSEVLLRQGAYTTGLEQAQTALAELPQQSGSIWARLQTIAGSFYYRMGRYAESQQTYLEALRELEKLEAAKEQFSLVEQERNRLALVECYRSLGAVYWAQGNMQPAEEYINRALKVYQQRNELFGIANCLDYLGLINRDGGNYPQSRQSFQQALTIFQQIGDQHRLAFCHSNLGIIAWRLGQLDEAEDYHQKALKIYQPIGAQFGIASCFNNLGLVFRDRGDLDKAEEYFEQSTAISQKIDDMRGLAYGYNYLGVVAHDKGQLQAAIKLYQRSLAVREKVGHKIGIAECYGRLGRAYLDQGNFAQALDYTERSRDIFEKIGVYGLTYVCNNLGLLYTQQGNLAEAAIWLEKALSNASRVGLAESHVEAYLNHGRLALAQGKAEAEQWFSQALEMAAGRYPLLIAAAYFGLAECKLKFETEAGPSVLQIVLAGHNLVTEKGLGLLFAWGQRVQALALHRVGRDEEAQEALKLSQEAALVADQQYELALTEQTII